jgi:hypothetical protein
VVIALPMPPVRLVVVILDETPVGLYCPFPGRNLLEMIITHPSHDRDYVELICQGLSSLLSQRR